MKTIGLVGGISWTSTIDYYRYFNEAVNARLGNLDFAECIIYSVNFEQFRLSNARHDWDGSFNLLSHAAINLQKAGADMILLGANTAHIVAERIEQVINIPLIDIRTETAKEIKDRGLRKVGLLGTRYTIELDFYKQKLASFNIESIIPGSAQDREFIEHTLLHELGKGIIKEKTREEYIRIAGKLIDGGAEGLILGCTEIPLLLSQENFNIPVFNTTQIHANAAVSFALK